MIELDLSILGRPDADLKPQVLDIRSLRESDLEISGPTQVAAPLIRIRSRHHLLAQILAEGRSNTEAGLLTGYSPSRISILKADPAFVELIEHYRAQVQAQYVNLHERLAALGLNAIEELQERLEEDAEGFTKRELMDVAALALDRAGYGPKSTINHSGTVGIVNADLLKDIKAELGRRRPTIDAEVLKEIENGSSQSGGSHIRESLPGTVAPSET